MASLVYLATQGPAQACQAWDMASRHLYALVCPNPDSVNGLWTGNGLGAGALPSSNSSQPAPLRAPGQLTLTGKNNSPQALQGENGARSPGGHGLTRPEN